MIYLNSDQNFRLGNTLKSNKKNIITHLFVVSRTRPSGRRSSNGRAAGKPVGVVWPPNVQSLIAERHRPQLYFLQKYLEYKKIRRAIEKWKSAWGSLRGTHFEWRCWSKVQSLISKNLAAFQQKLLEEKIFHWFSPKETPIQMRRGTLLHSSFFIELFFFVVPASLC